LNSIYSNGTEIYVIKSIYIKRLDKLWMNKNKYFQQLESLTLDMPGKLRSYQIEGVKFLMERDSALLADEMGLGKTVQVSVALELLWLTKKIDRTLVVCPASLKWNWMYEISRWAPDLSVQRTRGSSSDRLAHYMLPYNVLIASYEEIRTDLNSFPYNEDFDIVILDEAQRIKNPASKTALACSLLPRKRSWVLTGTPLENKPEDLIAIFSFVKFGLLKSGQSKLELHSRMKDYFVRRRKSEVAEELPPIIEQEIELNLSGAQKQAYDNIWINRWDYTESNGSKNASSNFLAVITKLKQLCNYEPSSGESVKSDALRLIIESQNEPNDKLLLFSQYVKTLKWLNSNVKGIPRGLYHGGIREEKRQDELSTFLFKPGPNMLLMSLKAGGVGLNLPETSTVIMFDRWWNPAIEDQAVQRAHRFGRKRPLHVIKYLIKDSIEERIKKILHEKKNLFSDYIEAAESGIEPKLDRSILELLLSE
jgi:SNF2 family DNA or RNA helicase